MRKGNGFTLIELLIVLAILGILVGIVAMSVGDLTTTAESSMVDTAQQMAQAAIDTYNNHEVVISSGTSVIARATLAVIASA